MVLAPRFALTLAVVATCVAPSSGDELPQVIVDAAARGPATTGPFEPTWASLSARRVPDWFRDAKFGIWAHFGPQCQPEQGDWYARNMYFDGTRPNRWHVAHYGPTAQFGFKEVIRDWTAARWDPDDLLALYERAGARYFVAMANHHDNFDLWASKYQPWNSTRVGPRRDLIAEWARATRARGLRFGVSVHAAHAWMWYEPAQAADGKLTAADGRGTWWDGLDPQQLYAQSHPPSATQDTRQTWEWQNGCSQPDLAYCQDFYDRTIDLIDQSRPDLVAFDDTTLPLWPASDAGLKIAAHFYNASARDHAGTLDGVMLAKFLDNSQRRALVNDIERGRVNRIESAPWQAHTCLGNWHYSREIYEKDRYQSGAAVIRALVDVVSKNGNLLLNVPVRGDGTIDEKERAILEQIAAWTRVNGEAIYGSRPWKVMGEGPQVDRATTRPRANDNERRQPPTTAADVRYTTRDGAVYALTLGRPAGAVRLTAFAPSKRLLDATVVKVEQLGAGDVPFSIGDDALAITPDASKILAEDQTVVFKITTR